VSHSCGFEIAGCVCGQLAASRKADQGDATRLYAGVEETPDPAFQSGDVGTSCERAPLEIDGVETRMYRGFAHPMVEGQEVGGGAR
jgi:hypothetical protein